MAKAINVSEQRQRAINPSPVLGSWLRRIAFFILLLGIWQVLAMSGVWPDYLFPGPLAVFNALLMVSRVVNSCKPRWSACSGSR